MLTKFKQITYLYRHLRNWLLIKDVDQLYQNPKFLKNHSSSNANKIALVFVHGIADKPGTFNNLIQSIMPTLPKTVSIVLSISCAGRKDSIAFFAGSLIKKIKKHKTSHIILIGHSRGGLVCAYAAEYLAFKHNIYIEGVITIASPFHGSHLIRYPATTLVKSLEEMSVNSDFLNELIKRLEKNKYHHKYLFITCGNDLIVPQETAFLTIPYSQHINFNDFGHLTIVHSPELQLCISKSIKKWIAAFIKNSKS